MTDDGKLAYPFTLGVASGDPLPEAVVIWTRLAPSPLEPAGGLGERNVVVHWQLAHDDQFRAIARWGMTRAVPERGHAVHIDVQGLEPGRSYFYRFIAGGHESPIGRARTAPPPGARVSSLRFAFASCQNYEQGYYTAYRHMAAEALDFVVFLGDYIYESQRSQGRPRAHESDSEPTDLDGYRARYALYRSDRDLQSAHASCPWIVSWDDHGLDEAVSARRAARYRAFYEHMPLRSFAEPSGPDVRLYRRLRFGRLLELNVLDTRQPRGVTWLLDGLDRSRARWNVLAQHAPFALTDVEQSNDVARQDKCAAYPSARKRIVDFLAERKPRNPVVITGDLHNAWLTLLKQNDTDPESPTLGTEFIATSISSGGDGSEETDTARTVLARNPQVLFHNNRRGYVSVVVDDAGWHSAYRSLPYVTREGAPLETRAAFMVEDANPVPTRIA